MKPAVLCLMVLILLALGACNSATIVEPGLRAVVPALGNPGPGGGGGRRAQRPPDALQPLRGQA